MATPRWLADEMLGRLARYLRFVGHDTEYVRGLTDTEIAERARRGQRRLLTRDRELARRVPDALLLRSPSLPEQLRAVRAAEPAASYAVVFDRCSLCNGPLETWSPPREGAWPAGIPPPRGEVPRTIFACARCGHTYWEGSHTDRIRRNLAEWLAT